jgi:hypothetical protein
MVIVSHPNVNQYVRALLAALEAKGKLQEFHTTLNFGRRGVALPRSKIFQHAHLELVRLLGQRLGQNWLVSHDSGLASIDAVARMLDRRVAERVKSRTAVYCYEDSALATFGAAQKVGVKRYYELPIMYWTTTQKLLREEATRYPQWEPTLLATRDSPAKLERKTAELALADLVICPSRIVQKSLPVGARSQVAEYGCPAPVEGEGMPRLGRASGCGFCLLEQ